MEPVRLRISVARAKDLSEDELREPLERELAVLLGDLGLPLAVEIASEERTQLTAGRFVLSIDGKPLHPSRPGPYADSEHAGDRLAALLHAAREKLVTSELTAALWREWSRSDAPEPGQFGKLLRRLVSYRLRPVRVARLAQIWEEVDPEEVFEQALSSASRRIVVELPPDAYGWLAPDLAPSGELLPFLVDSLFTELGVHIGECVFSASDRAESGSLRVQVNDLRGPPIPYLKPGECLVNDTLQRLRLMKIPGRKAANPATGHEGTIVPDQYKDICEQAGLTTWTPAGYVVLALAAVIRASAAQMLSREMLELSLETLEVGFPRLLERTRRDFGVIRLANVLRLLLAEQLSIRNLPVLMEAVLTVPPPTEELANYVVFASTWNALRLRLPDLEPAPEAEIAEYVRGSVRNYVSYKHSRGTGTLVAYLLGSEIEHRLTTPRALTDAETEAIFESLLDEMDHLPPTAQLPVLLTSNATRRRLRGMLEPILPRMQVLSYQDLSPELNIQPVSRIRAEFPLVTPTA